MRQARKYSETGLYHVVSRGVNKQNIFLDEKDKEYFLFLLEKYSKKYEIQVHTHCLLDNHFHLLIKDTQTDISAFMQSLESVYARAFNKKYDRVGHLFQNRFLSEVISDEIYYKTVFRYILQNPEKAGICCFSEYKWSSYKLYKKPNSLIKLKHIMEHFTSKNELYHFLHQASDNECIDIELRPSERQIYNINKIKSLLNSNSPLIPPDIPINEIKSKIRILRAAGLSIRTISRITGIMSWIVSKA